MTVYSEDKLREAYQKLREIVGRPDELIVVILDKSTKEPFLEVVSRAQIKVPKEVMGVPVKLKLAPWWPKPGQFEAAGSSGTK